jgi:hypothetical protein
VSIWGRDISWAPVVVLDHPSPPEGLVLGGSGTFVLLRRDWEFLFEQLQSTVAVIDYLLRVAPMDPVALGLEALRYYDLAQADAIAAPAPPDPGFAGLSKKDVWIPVLPLRPVQRSNLIRWILEDIGEVPAGELDEAHARHRLRTLAAIDSAPVAERAGMAEAILSWLEQVQLAPPEKLWWRVRHYLYLDRVHLIVGVTNQNSDEVREAFGHLVQLRHVKRGERSAKEAELVTVGVLIQPNNDGRRPWDTSAGMVEGNVPLSEEERDVATSLWGSIEEAVRRADAPDEETRSEGSQAQVPGPDQR